MCNYIPHKVTKLRVSFDMCTNLLKIQNKGSAIALNSSYPKHKLYINDSKTTSACKKYEDWDVKDIIYAIGITNDQELQCLCLVYGDYYAASKEVYSRIGETIKQGIIDITDLEFSETNELGRVNRVDPLGITNLRIREMWHIDNHSQLINAKLITLEIT